MKTTRGNAVRLGAVAAVVALVLTACGGGSIDDETKANEDAGEGSGDCGDLKIAINPWVGYEASAYVVGEVAKQELGCNVSYPELKEDVAWQGFGTGEVDVVIEDWGHPDLEDKFFAEKGDGSATDFGPQGNVGIIGWFVPPWLAEEHPEILDYNNLNDFASEFETSESGGKGQFLGADPSLSSSTRRSWPTSASTSRSSSPAARPPRSRRSARPRRTRSGSSATGTSRSTSTPRSRAVGLPAAVRGGLPGRPQTVACDYPETVLKKIVGTEWSASGDASVDPVQSFE